MTTPALALTRGEATLARYLQQVCGCPRSEANAAPAYTRLLLGTLFCLSGVLKTFMAPSALVSIAISWASDVPLWSLRLSGSLDIAAAVALLLPALTRTLPFMTPLVALAVAAGELAGIGFHAVHGEFASTAQSDLVLLALSLVLGWAGLKAQAAAFAMIDDRS